LAKQLREINKRKARSKKMANIPKSNQIGITSQRNKWANTDPPDIYRRWDHVPRRSKHPLLTGRPHRESHFKRKKKTLVKINVKIRETESAVKISASNQVN
jgi:hypothetical protein